jgi:hypothetical protein
MPDTPPTDRNSAPVRLLDFAPILWLALIALAFAALALYPNPESAALARAPVPPVEAAERLLPPALALLIVTGIIRYCRSRSSDRAAAGPPQIRDRNEPRDRL